MNRWIAKWFAHVLTVLHVLFFASLVIVLFQYFRGEFPPPGNTMHSGFVIPMLLLAAALYIVVMGVISTFVSINSYLAELVEQGNRKSESGSTAISGQTKERIEPDF